MKTLFITFAALIILFIFVISIMIAIPPAGSIPALESVAAPFRKVGFSGVPDLKYITSRNGTKLAYREYSKHKPKYTAVLVHGSSGSSRSIHPLAEYLNRQGMHVYVPDIRGHGASGIAGDIDYIGQLEDDMEDFAVQILKGQKATLVGFSLGGGFVLRFAASDRQKLFTNYILLSPFIGGNAPTVKPDSGGWAEVSYPRIIGISILGKIGEKIFGSLPVITYAIDPRTAKYQVSHYSFRLLNNLSPHFDYKTDIASVKQPLSVLIGKDDELHSAYAFEQLFIKIKPDTTVTIVPGVGHIALTTGLSGIMAIAEAIKTIN